MSSVEKYIFEQERKLKEDEEKMNNEKYYWTDSKGNKIPKHELDNYHLCNIVMKFGKNWLSENGHVTLVRRFEEMNREHNFFECVKGKDIIYLDAFGIPID